MVWKAELATITKGQLISKCLFGVFNSPKKQMKTIRLEVPSQCLCCNVDFSHPLGKG